MIDLKTLKPLIRQIAEEKGLSEQSVFEALEIAFAAAYKKEYGKKTQIVHAKINPENGELKFWQTKLVLDPASVLTAEEEEKLIEEKKTGIKEDGDEEMRKIKFNPERHILLAEAKKIKPDSKVDEELIFPLEIKSDFSRIAAQTAKQVILQKLKEFERETVLSEFKEKEGKIVNGIIQRIERKNIYVDLGKTFGVLYINEGIPREYYRVGERKKFYILRLEEKGRGPTILLSRSHPKFVSGLFEIEVPEISEGIVEIKSIAREPGNRTKIAVASNEESVDPVGACVGQKGTRVTTIIDELNGEKIDIIPYSEEPTKYVAAALGPAKISETEVISEKREVRVFVPPEQLSLAIGKNGQNVRLAAKLTGWKIDIRSALAPEETIQDGIAEAEELAEEQTKTELDPIKETNSKKEKNKKDEIKN
ncbi:MAG: transcription termination factor NusA [Candidatus Pacebacteria bacterium]|nr:transcription termination factor NusA [Candidatus Paceibacterota bacterium]MDD5721908.1 transcription termination factor NusA [Candidatus Paceibacterota bacterium]